MQAKIQLLLGLGDSAKVLGVSPALEARTGLIKECNGLFYIIVLPTNQDCD
jgi:hypothetical protein